MRPHRAPDRRQDAGPKLDAAFETPEAKRRHVRQLFATIADRYDLITRLLSFGQDRRWKNRLVREARAAGPDLAIDLACGTGDIARLLKERGVQHVVGLDVTHRMLVLARRKGTDIAYLAGDMTALPFGRGAADLVTAGYGLRNVPDLDRTLAEIARVLRPGGRFLSLDFNRPDDPVVRWVYLTYLGIVGGVLGWILHGDPDTYRYIPASIRRYPGAAGVADRLRAGGFEDVRVVPLLFGLMSLHVARRQ
ncbi:MAG: ubiquinone/menaquinone biosynthesis methyltransferase [Acidobacteriota bacterium]|nr:ubiquinone/menaquinone biosynthesis methyltransferase [Acidobacteriota bacterium]